MIRKVTTLDTRNSTEEKNETQVGNPLDVRAIKIDLYMALAKANSFLPPNTKEDLMQQNNGAKHWYEKVLMLDAQHFQARLGLIRMVIEEGELEHALIMLEDTLKLDPLRIEVLLEMAKVHRRLKNYGEVQAVLQKIRAIQQDYPYFIEWTSLAWKPHSLKDMVIPHVAGKDWWLQ